MSNEKNDKEKKDVAYVRISGKSLENGQNFVFLSDQPSDAQKLYKGDLKKVNVKSPVVNRLIRENVIEKVSDDDAKRIITEKEAKEASDKETDKAAKNAKKADKDKEADKETKPEDEK